MKQKFDIAKWAMVLLIIISCTPSFMILLITVRCVFWWIDACERDNSRITIYRDWLSEIVPVLVAIIMTRRTTSKDDKNGNDE